MLVKDIALIKSETIAKRMKPYLKKQKYYFVPEQFILFCLRAIFMCVKYYRQSMFQLEVQYV
jgi:hypothetical protein